MHSKTQPSYQPRIRLTEQIRRNFFENIFDGDLPKLSYAKGLPYNLVYNLVHGRIHSLSARDYKRIFGEDPPYQEPKRVDGKFFRGLVRLWLFLNDEISEADLYKELYEGKKFIKVDYRIFNEDIKTVETRLERRMEQKFLDQGVDHSQIKQWIEELDQIHGEKRVSYDKIKPILDYLEEALEVNPSRILNQWALRYESGELKTVPKKTYDRALALRKRTEDALANHSELEIEKLREEVYGKRKGLTLFYEIQGELEFLQKYAGKSAKGYLGRSIAHYKTSKLKRIATWRAQRIKADCHELIKNKPGFPLQTVPKSYLKMQIMELESVLKSYLGRKIMEGEGGAFERVILTPSSYSKEAYQAGEYGYTSMDQAGYVLGMRKKAFDLLVAENCDLFRRIGRYTEKWYLPNLYLKELTEKEGFDLLVEKYELLAKGERAAYRLSQCLTARS